MGSPTIIATRSFRVRPMLLAAALLLAGVPAWAGAATPAPRPSVTLEQAISRAMTQDPRMVKARGDQAVAAAAQKSAFGNYLPNLSVSASVGASQTNVPAATDVAGSAGAGVSLGYDLFTGFRRGAQTTQADAQATQAQAALTGNAANVALGVEQTFFVTLQAKELLEVANARLRTAQEALDAATRKAAAGLGTRSDQLRAEVELNSAQQALLEAKTQADVQAYALGRQIGVDGPVDAQIDASAPVQDAAFDGEAFIQELLSSAPDLVSAQAQLRAADAGVQVAKSSYLPQVSASAGYDWNTRFDPALPGNAGWSVRVGISLPLFDGFARDESLTRAESQARTAQATLADTRRGLRATAEQLLGALELSDSKITLAQKSVAAAEEDLRVQQQRYAEGVSTMLDLLTSEAGATQARTGLVQARFDYRVARAQLLALAGKVS